MMIDLSFTKDPEWIKKRKVKWRSEKRELLVGTDKKTIANLEHYFFTGELCEGCPDTDYARYTFFPLQSPEGWDYIFQHVVKSSDVFLRCFYESIGESWPYIDDYENELAEWDYFHPEFYQQSITSRVPVGGGKERVTISPNPHKLCAIIVRNISGYINGRLSKNINYPKWILHKSYFYSIFPHLDADCFYSTGEFKTYPLKSLWAYKQSVGFATRRLMEQALRFQPAEHIDDPEQNREAFLQNFVKTVEDMNDVPESMKMLWDLLKEDRDPDAYFAKINKRSIFTFWKRN